MRTFFAMVIVPLLAAGAGGCTFEHNDYYGSRHRHADACYRTERVETHYGYSPRYEGRHYRQDYYRRDPYCR